MHAHMDVHDIPGVKADAVAEAHAADVRIQDKYGVNYKKYWVNKSEGKVFCLVDAPNEAAAAQVHREAHGLEAHTIYEVAEGDWPRLSRGTAKLPGRRSLYSKRIPCAPDLRLRPAHRATRPGHAKALT